MKRILIFILILLLLGCGSFEDSNKNIKSTKIYDADGIVIDIITQ